MNNASPLVYIVILNYKYYDVTSECIRTVEKIFYPNYRVVIVDNGSGNRSEEILRKKYPHHIFIQTGSNSGYAAGNNVGIKKALNDKADYILILNNDTRVAADFLDKLVAYADSNKDVGILSPKIVTESGELDPNCARRRPEFSYFLWRIGIGNLLFPNNKYLRTHYYLDEYDFKVVKKVDIVSGACMLIRQEVLREIGLLDENTFLYYEELILHEKIRKTNYSTVLVPHSKIIHKKHQSTRGSYGNQQESYNSLNYYLRNYRDFGKFKTIIILLNVKISIVIIVLIKFMSSILKKIKKITSMRNNIKYIF